MPTPAECLKAAIASALLLAAQSGPAAETPPAMEKCYGIAKAGKNDCQTAASACAGSSKSDDQPDAWIYVPQGTCAKITGGSVTPGSVQPG